jgi:hypothetical protein
MVVRGVCALHYSYVRSPHPLSLLLKERDDSIEAMVAFAQRCESNGRVDLRTVQAPSVNDPHCTRAGVAGIFTQLSLNKNANGYGNKDKSGNKEEARKKSN